jgi:DNA-binding CsgD family transcriptional regulator
MRPTTFHDSLGQICGDPHLGLRATGRSRTTVIAGSVDGPSVVGGQMMTLRGRRTECAVLDALLAGMRCGRSGALVVRGEAGVGKTALLEYAVESASDVTVLRAVGVESEMELAFAGLLQLCTPLLGSLAELPAPQREALEIVFGITAGPAPDRFLVGLAVLNLLSEAASSQPLLCVVDDAQWLDTASALVLAFVARRLLAEAVVFLFASRELGGEPGDLPELQIQGLRSGDARALLGSVVAGRLDDRVRDVIIAETRGNPLALLELPRGLSPAQLAGGFGVTSALSLSTRIEESFLRQLHSFPEDTQRLLLLAAAEPLGDPVLLWGAAQQLKVPYEALTIATSVGMLEVGTCVRFRHPLVRSGVYRAAPLDERQRVHRALAEVTDPYTDPDRRAWHRAQAAPGPDEEVAEELGRSAGRAQARGGLAAAAAFLERAGTLSVDPARRSERMLAAAEVNVLAGSFDAALRLLSATEPWLSSELQRARLDLLRGQIAFASGVGRDASRLLLSAAQLLESLDVTLARETYLEAWVAAFFAGSFADGGDLLAVSRAAREAPKSPGPPGPSDLLLDANAALITDGRAVAAPMLARALSAFTGRETSTEERLRWGWLFPNAAVMLWDDANWHAGAVRQLQLERDAGALARVPFALMSLGLLVSWYGEFDEADALVAESDLVAEATGALCPPIPAMLLAALRGREADALALINSTKTGATATGQGVGVQSASWVAALLYNGLGRYEEALADAQLASDEMPHLHVSAWALIELIEAAVHSGHPEIAESSIERLVAGTRAGGTDWALGIEARSRALLTTGAAAEALYCEAIDRLRRTKFRPELARAHLLHGEWLRRANRRVDAREQLRTAHQMFDDIGMTAFAERAERELLATGERARKRTVATLDDLTPQELRIAQMARDGLSNPEIGIRLFISPRTVKYHLQKVFTKLDIKSRGQLAHKLPREDSGVSVS